MAPSWPLPTSPTRWSSSPRSPRAPTARRSSPSPKDRRGWLHRGFEVSFRHGPVLAVDARATAEAGEFRPTAIMGRICEALTRAGELNFRDLKARVRGRDEHIREALAVLIDEGNVKVRNGPRGAKLHYLVVPFNE